MSAGRLSQAADAKSENVFSRVRTLNPTSAPPRDRQRTDLLNEFLPKCKPAELEDIGLCLDPAVLRRHFVEAGLCARSATDAMVIRLYFTDERCQEYSPNLLFSELWYRADNPDVARARESDGLPAFVHFIRYGITEGRWPNAALSKAAAQFQAPAPLAAAIDPRLYPASNEEALALATAFPVLAPLELYNRYGRFLHHPLPAEDSARAGETSAQRFAILKEEFDPAFYARTYLADPELEAYRTDPFAHYTRFGIDLGYSPSAAFEEDWYRAFYRDVREAIRNGDVPCGFYHYVMSGRSGGKGSQPSI